MTSKVQSQNILYEITNSNSNKKTLNSNNSNGIFSNSNSIKNINNNEDKENIKSFNNKELSLAEDEYVKKSTETTKTLNKRNNSDSTLKFPSSIENFKENIINNVNNRNSNENIAINKDKKSSLKQNKLLKHSSSSSFQTAYSSSSDSIENVCKTTKSVYSEILEKSLNIDKSLNVDNSKNIENSQNEIANFIKATNPIKAKDSTKSDSSKSVKIYHIKKEKGCDINNSSSSLGKKMKTRNNSKDFSNSHHFPNHLMLSDNNSKTSFKKEEITQKLSISSLSITKAHSLKRQTKAIENIIGTPIKKDHVHYILMLDMLNGIRYSVQRCNASTNRELYLKDFKAKHKIALDVYNNELLPSSKYYYKFKDYAPRVFRSIREIFKISSENYLMSLTGKYMLTEMDSPGKSGSFFYYSQDYRFIIKTVHHSEHKHLLKILKNYYMFLKKNPNTLICKIFGLHRVKIQHGKKIHFIVMENIFPPDKDIHEKYDLKGSIVGRYTNEKDITSNKSLILKDLNWLKKERKLYLGKEKGNIFIKQLEKDVKFLSENCLMDYSLLVGCHNLNKGNKENIRDSTLSIIEPNPESLSKNIDIKRKTKKDPMAMALARAIAETEPVSLEVSSSSLPESIPKGKKHFIFYRDDGGFRATDENNKELQEIYFMGIIDIFTNYNMKKKMEFLCKSIISDRKNISSVNPTFYSKRFLKFIEDSIGHDSRESRLKKLKPNPRQYQSSK